MIPFKPPDWFVAMRNCAYLGEPFCQAMGIAYGPVVEAWTITAQSAENGAREYLHKKAERDA